ncbi:hypothetical protein AGMMS50239_06360 [Bacteroidia bacterium]|nr:hypothetical protein AGMMS50239_06360 [Bacteroidia bacterium]
MEIIDVFINRKGEFLDNIVTYVDFVKFLNPIFLTSPECFEKAYDVFLKYHRFRLWIHLEYENYPPGVGFLKSIKNEHENINVQFISRNNSIKVYSDKEYKVDYSVYYALGSLQYWKDVLPTIIVNEPIANRNFPSFEQKDMSSLKSTKTIDIAILTALIEDEYNVCKDLMDGQENGNKFIGKFKNTTEQVVLLSQQKMGMVDCAISTKKIFEDINPKLLLLGGVCGGRKSKVKKYDIIIPKNIIDIITGKLKNGQPLIYGFNVDISDNLQQYIEKKTTADDFIKKEMYNLVPSGNKYDRERNIINKLKIHHDTMACGAFVLSTDNYLEKTALGANEKIVGYEMESYGLVRAANLTQKLSLVIKSVMDYTDSNKSDASTQIEDEDNIPEGENVKKMASYMSFICIQALIPHLREYLNQNSNI